MEAQAAFGNGAEGIGLFRLKCSIWIAPVHRAKASCTTFLSGAGVRQRTQHYCAHYGYCGDKPVDYLNIPAEANPFLGIAPCVFMKSTRRYLPHNYGRSPCLRSRQPENHDPDDLFNEEILWVKEKLAEAKQQLRNETFRLMRRSSSASCWKCRR